MKRHYAVSHLCRAATVLFLIAAYQLLSFQLAPGEDLYQFVQKWPALSQPWYFQNLEGIAVDGSGNVYVSDSYYNHIQKFTSTGIFQTEWGEWGYDEGQMSNPAGIAIDSSGNVYVVDSWNNRIQKFTSSGVFLNSWGSIGSGNGQFTSPSGIALDAAGNVYVADTGNHRIQKFTSAGAYVTKWGTEGSGNGQFNDPRGIAVDSGNNVYVVDTGNHRIQKFTSAGTYLTRWGAWGTEAGQFNTPQGVAVDGSGNVYVADTDNHQIQKFTSTGVFTAVLVSYGELEGGVYYPTGIAIDASGTLYVADDGNNRVQKFTSDGGFIAAWSSSGSDSGEFDTPAGLTVDATGAVYVADSSNSRIQKFNGSGVFISELDHVADGGNGFLVPQDVAVDDSGTVYVLDSGKYRVVKFNPAGEYISEWGSHGNAGGQFDFPQGIAVDGSNRVYVADTGNDRIQVFSSSGVYLTQWGSEGSGNGKFQYPVGIAVDINNNDVYVADMNNHRIQKFTSMGTFLTAWGTQGSTEGRFMKPADVAIDSSGNIYVADKNNNRIQKFTSSGNYLTEWGSQGTRDGQFFRPHSIALAGNAVYVSDTENNRIQMFWRSFTLYYPHCDTGSEWETEIALINTSASHTLNGILVPVGESGLQASTIVPITLLPNSRRQITAGAEFSDADSIRYFTLYADTDSAKGYTKFSQDGLYRVAVPAVSISNAGDIIIPHIASDDTWWTGIALVNTTASVKELIMEFDNGATRSLTLNPYEHRAFTIESLFGGSAQPSLHSGLITNSEGVIGLELFGSTAELGGIPLSDATEAFVYYPHVASTETWWTGIVAYNPYSYSREAVVLPFNAAGTPLSATTIDIPALSRYSQEVSGLGLPAETAWFMVTSTEELSGFELFGTRDGNAMAGVCSMGTRGVQGVFAKLEKSGWTGIALVNAVASAATVTLSAYDDSGTVRAVRTITLDPFEKVVEVAENLFPGQDLRPATYIGYTSTQNLVGFQLNGSEDGTMLDGLPGM